MKKLIKPDIVARVRLQSNGGRRGPTRPDYLACLFVWGRIL